MFRHHARVAAALSVLVVAAVGCSSSDGTSPTGSCNPGGTTICAVNTAFSPATLTVQAGATITFHNADGFEHTTTSSSVPTGATTWDRTLSGGGETTMTLNTPGTYQYYCRIHGTPTTGMRGTIVVQ